uniref:Uncharacterized protein n=1 Tax=Anguilla anguilla TaxID=7936 RepID=A0A0E9T407_ANGAN
MTDPTGLFSRIYTCVSGFGNCGALSFTSETCTRITRLLDNGGLPSSLAITVILYSETFSRSRVPSRIKRIIVLERRLEFEGTLPLEFTVDHAVLSSVRI